MILDKGEKKKKKAESKIAEMEDFIKEKQTIMIQKTITKLTTKQFLKSHPFSEIKSEPKLYN